MGIPALAAWLALVPSALATTCDPGTQSCFVKTADPAKPGPRTFNWGQGDPLVRQNIYKAMIEASSKDDGFFKKLFGTEPTVVDTDAYLVSHSPAIATSKGDPKVTVAKSALDLAQSAGELAFIVGHELRHTRHAERKRKCLNYGFQKKWSGSDQYRFLASEKVKKYQRDIENEADAWGQYYAFVGGFSATDAPAAIEHIGGLAWALRAENSTEDHDDLSKRQEALKGFSTASPKAKLFRAKCPFDGFDGDEDED